MIAPGRRLKAGDRGQLVRSLQEALESLGFSVGPVDGYFGLWTEDGLRDFQAYYELRVDGIAGEEVWRLLKDRAMRPKRILCRLGSGVALRQMGEKYHVAEGAIRQANRIKGEDDLYPGRVLTIPCREVWAKVGAGMDLDQYLPSLTRHRNSLTGLILPWLEAAGEGTVENLIQSEILNWGRRHGLSPVASLALPHLRAGCAKRAARTIKRLAADFKLGGILIEVNRQEDLPVAAGILREARDRRNPCFLTMIQVNGEEGRFEPGAWSFEMPDRLASRELPRQGYAVYKTLLPVNAAGFDPAWGEMLGRVRRQKWGGVILSGIGKESERIWRLLGQEFAPGPSYFTPPCIIFDSHYCGWSPWKKGEVGDGNLPAGEEAAGGGDHR